MEPWWCLRRSAAQRVKDLDGSRCSGPPGLAGFAILADCGATALSVGACSSKSQDEGTSRRRRANDEAKVYGLVGVGILPDHGRCQVTEAELGQLHIDVSPGPRSSRSPRNAELDDVAAGNCVRVVTHRRLGARWRCRGPNPWSVRPPAVTAICPQTEECSSSTPGGPPPGRGHFCRQATSSTSTRAQRQRQSLSNHDVTTLPTLLIYVEQASATAEAIRAKAEVHHHTRTQGWWRRRAQGDDRRLGSLRH